MRRVGLVGYGLAGRLFHAPLIECTEGLEVAAVVTTDPARAAQAADDLPDVLVTADTAALFAAGSSIDLIVVATANVAHETVARRAIEAHVPVVVDKPLAPTASGARTVVAEAASAGVPLTVFQNRRWDNDFLTLHGLVASGQLGEVHRFESRFERWAPALRRHSWREDPRPEMGAGLLLDLGAHLVDQALVLFGPVATIGSTLDRRRPGSEVDDDVFVELTHTNGVRTHLWMSAVASRPGPRFRVLGRDAGFVRWGLDPQEQQLKEGIRPGDAGWGRQPPSQDGTIGVGDRLTVVPTLPGAYQDFYAMLVDALDGRGPLPVDPWDAVRVVEILDAARQAAIEGRRVVPPPERRC